MAVGEQLFQKCHHKFESSLATKHLKIHQKVSTSKIQLTNCIYSSPIHLLFGFDPLFAYKLITSIFTVIVDVTFAYIMLILYKLGYLDPQKIQSHLKCCYFQHKKGRRKYYYSACLGTIKQFVSPYKKEGCFLLVGHSITTK